MNIPTTILTLLAGIAITLLSLWFGQNNNLLPLAAAENAGGFDSLFNVMFAIAMGLFLLVQGLIVIAAIKFRQRPGDDSDGPPIHGNIPLEILWTAIPAVLVLGVSVYSFDIYNRMGGLDPMNHGGHSAHSAPTAQMMAYESSSGEAQAASQDSQYAGGIGARPGGEEKPADVVVNVTGLQYAWIFNYPNGIISGELHIPANRDVQLNLSAQDVLHAFWVPQFRLKQDAIPGRQTELRFVPTEPGTYPIVCAELCGSYHGAMRSQVIVETPEAYDSWVQSQVAMLNGGEELAGEAIAANPEGEFLAPFAEAMAMDMSPSMMHSLHGSGS